MPCAMPDDETLDRLHRELVYKTKGDEATRLLCELLTQIEAGGIITISKELAVWWANHQLEDLERKHRERLEELKKIKSTGVFSFEVPKRNK